MDPEIKKWADILKRNASGKDAEEKFGWDNWVQNECLYPDNGAINDVGLLNMQVGDNVMPQMLG